MLYEEVTRGLKSNEEKILACWTYVANIPYRETIASRITVNGKTKGQSDLWLYPAETIKLAPVANCANKSFLLTSLLRNVLSESEVYCALGHLNIDGIGAHAWVAIYMGQDYILETTISQLEKALIPEVVADAYEPVIYFNDMGVYTVLQGYSVTSIVNERFGFCAIPWLRSYLCEKCLELEV